MVEVCKAATNVDFYKGVKEQGDHSHWNALKCTKNTWILNASVEENLYQPPKIFKGKRCIHTLDSLKKAWIVWNKFRIVFE